MEQRRIIDEQGFLAGIDFLQHLLQQTPCTTHVCDCGNELTEKELFYETCLKCDKVLGQIA